MSVRFSEQPWDAIVARLIVIEMGAGQTGLAPVVAVQRLSDGLWLQAGGGSWGAGGANNNLVEVDAANLPGLYEYPFPSAAVDYALSREGYRLKYTEATTPVLEYEYMAVKPVVSTELGAGAATAGAPSTVTLGTWAPATANFYQGQLVTIIGGLGQGQTRVVTSYTAGRVATVYPEWTTVPNATSVVSVHGQGNAGYPVWNEPRSKHVAAGTFGEGTKLYSLTAAGSAYNEVGHAVWRRDATTGAFGAAPTGAEADWLSGGALQPTWWATIFAALAGGSLRGGSGTFIQSASKAHAAGTRFYVAATLPDDWVGTYAVYVPADVPTLRPLDGDGAGGRTATVVKVTATGNDGTPYLVIENAVTGEAVGNGAGVALTDWLIGIHAQSAAQAREVWEADIEAMVGGSGGTMLPPTDSRTQRSAAGLLQAVNEASVQGFRDSTNSEWENVFVASAVGTTTKFYFAAASGPAVAGSANWAGKPAVFIAAASGNRRLCKVVSVATDGAVHFVLALPDGSPLPVPVALNDRLLVLQAGEASGLTVNDIFTASMSAYETAGTFGNAINRMLRLRQENMRVVYTDWSSHGQPTAGYVLLYSSAADLNSDVDPWPLAKGRYDFAATYDADLQLTGYESVRTL